MSVLSCGICSLQALPSPTPSTSKRMLAIASFWQLLAFLIISWLIDSVSLSNLFLKHLIGVPRSERLRSRVKVLAKARISMTFASAVGAATLWGKSGPKLSNSRMASLRRFHTSSCATFFLATSFFGKKGTLCTERRSSRSGSVISPLVQRLTPASTARADNDYNSGTCSSGLKPQASSGSQSTQSSWTGKSAQRSPR